MLCASVVQRGGFVERGRTPPRGVRGVIARTGSRSLVGIPTRSHGHREDFEDEELGLQGLDGKGGRVGDTVDSCGRVDNLDILCGFAMISLCPQDDIGYQGLAWYVPEILILRRAYGKKILKLSCFE